MNNLSDRGYIIQVPIYLLHINWQILPHVTAALRNVKSKEGPYILGLAPKRGFQGFVESTVEICDASKFESTDT